MFKRLAVLPVIAVLIGLLSGCATTGPRYAKTLEPGIFEDCFEMNAGQILEYSFEAEKPVNFNIHYHEDDKMFFPVSEDSVVSKRGTFIAEKKQYYCFMLTNPYQRVISFDYQLSVKE
jgi:hypothetical protein